MTFNQKIPQNDDEKQKQNKRVRQFMMDAQKQAYKEGQPLKHIPTKVNPAFDTQYILIGEDAWSYWDHGRGLWTFIRDAENLELDHKPIIVGEAQLKNIPELKLGKKNQSRFDLIECGTLTEPQKYAICHNLALKTQAGVVLLKAINNEIVEDWSKDIEKIRQDEELAKSAGEKSLGSMISQSTVEAPNTQPYITYRNDEALQGLYYITPRIDRMTGEVLGEKKQWICDRLELVGKGKNENLEYFYIFEWQNHDEKGKRQEAINCGDFGTDTAWRLLKNQGFKMSPKSGVVQNLVEHFHIESLNVPSWTVSHSTGWQCGAYLLPNGEILGQPTTPVIFKNKSASSSGYNVRGTVESWKNEVAFYVNKNISMMLGIATAFASPLLRLVNAKSFGVHLFDLSSKGKTTTLNVANSIYGNPDVINLSWNTTPTALSNEASSRNDGFVTLDELGQAKKIYDVENIAYSLFNEMGRARGMKEGGNNELSRWKITALSTGEKDVEGYLKSKGIDINAGQLVRLLNVPLTEARHFYDFRTAKEHADHLNSASMENYGAVGRAWIQFISENQDYVKSQLKIYREKWSNRLASNASSQVQRVASNFAILETALQLASHLTGWNEEDNRECLIKSFNDWIASYGVGNREEMKVVEYIDNWLRSNAINYLLQVPRDPQQRVREIYGYHVMSDNRGREEHFYLNIGALSTLANNIQMNKDFVLRALHQNKMLKGGGEPKREFQHKAKKDLFNDIGPGRFYILYKQPEEEIN